MSEMTVHEVLVKARCLIEREDDWCQGAGATTRFGFPVEPVDDPSAARFCSIGALDRVSGGDSPATRQAATRLAEAVGLTDLHAVPDWNDSHAHVEVLALFDKAIAATAPMPADPFPTPDPEDSRVLELVA